MNAPNDNTAARRLRRWWLTPPRSGLHRFISPWEYRNLRAWAGVRFGVAIVPAAAGFVCLSYGVYGWAAFFLVIAVLELAAGFWFLTIDHSTSART